MSTTIITILRSFFAIQLSLVEYRRAYSTIKRIGLKTHGGQNKLLSTVGRSSVKWPAIRRDNNNLMKRLKP